MQLGKTQIGNYYSETYNSENTKRKSLNQKVQIGTSISEENTIRKTKNGEIQAGKYKSINTDRENTNQKMLIGKYRSKNEIWKIHIGNIQFGKCKSENTCRKIQVGRIVGKVQIGTIYDIATLQRSLSASGGGIRRIHV